MSTCILAIDTSSSHCSVALQHVAGTTSEHAATAQSHSEQVLPMVRRVLGSAGVALGEVDVFASGIGPGGFTGVRLGVAVVQGLAYASERSVIGMSSLLVLAHAAWRTRAAGVTQLRVCVANDARMSQVYWAVYDFSCDGAAWTYEEQMAPSLSDVSGFSDELMRVVLSDESTEPESTNTVLAGNAFSVFDELAKWSSDLGVPLADVDHSAPHAVDLLALAQLAWDAQAAVRPHELAPLYVRDKIALTIVERDAVRLAKEAASNA